MAQSYTETQADIDIARTGIMIQAHAHNLNVNDPNIKAFLEHQIKVRAADLAGLRFYSFKCGPQP